MRFVIAFAVAAAIALGSFVAWKLTRRPADAPDRVLFARDLPDWEVFRSHRSALAPEALTGAIARAEQWPEIQAALRDLDRAWPDSDEVRNVVGRLNGALRASRLAYWVDAQFPGGSPVLLTYEIAGRSLWRSQGRSTEVLRVRRLDRLNVEMALLGHAGGGQPVVLLDRIEAELVESMRGAYGDTAAGNEVDRLALDLWRTLAEGVASAKALMTAAGRIARRQSLLDTMERRLGQGRVRVPRPERLVFGPEYFEALAPYAKVGRHGGPLILASDLSDLRRADEALRDGDPHRAFLAVLDLEAGPTEAHEARHALFPEAAPTPEALLDVVGRDDPEFAAMAERELRAYLSEIRDGPGPACLPVLRIACVVAGRNARRTPHFFSGHLVLPLLDGGDGTTPVDVAPVLERLCALPDAELRTRASAVFAQLYGEPMPVAERSVAP